MDSRQLTSRHLALPTAFWRWFRASQVVDTHGAPLRVYHGTNHDLTKFVWSGRNGAMFGTGLYFTDSPVRARAWAKGTGANIMPVYLSIQHPAYFDSERAWFAATGAGSNLGDLAIKDAFVRSLKRRGHDGLIINRRELPGRTREFVVFRAEQAKSATGNRGAYDPAAADITM